MDFSDTDGTIEIVFQVVGTTTAKLERLEVGDCLEDVVGRSAGPQKSRASGRSCVWAGGSVLPHSTRSRGRSSKPETTLKVLLGSRDREHLILTDRIEELDAGLEIATDDGSVGSEVLSQSCSFVPSRNGNRTG